MIKALLLIFEPVATWEGIHRASRSMVSILAVYLLPLLLLVAVCEGYGLVHWGKRQGEVPRLGRAGFLAVTVLVISLALPCGQRNAHVCCTSFIVRIINLTAFNVKFNRNKRIYLCHIYSRNSF